MLTTIPQSNASASEATEWCRRLEAGDILFFPQSPTQLPAQDISFLLNQHQSGSGLHKNIAYKPDAGVITGLDAKTAGSDSADRLRRIMKSYSEQVEGFLAGFLLPYNRKWQLDYASFRPQEEQGRDLPLRRRNDLLHTDAFPTRPTYGSRILRFFNNLHPTRTRDWVVTDTFAQIAPKYAPQAIPLPVAAGIGRRAVQKLARATPLGKAVPNLKRTAYDDFMMRFHNFLKENLAFQAECPKYPIQFPPGSSWMVYTDMVPHAVLAGQFALEQTLLVDRSALVAHATSPLSVLESMTHSTLI